MQAPASAPRRGRERLCPAPGSQLQGSSSDWSCPGSWLAGRKRGARTASQKAVVGAPEAWERTGEDAEAAEDGVGHPLQATSPGQGEQQGRAAQTRAARCMCAPSCFRPLTQLRQATNAPHERCVARHSTTVRAAAPLAPVPLHQLAAHAPAVGPQSARGRPLLSCRQSEAPQTPGIGVKAGVRYTPGGCVHWCCAVQGGWHCAAWQCGVAGVGGAKGKTGGRSWPG